MKRIIIFSFALALAFNGFAQSKKELAERIDSLAATVNVLKNEITTLQSSLKLLTETNNLLEKKLKFQEDINESQSATIKNLQNDLSTAKTASAAPDPCALITDPKNEEDSIMQLVQLYFSAKRWEDRLPFVYKPDEVKNYMPKKYTEGIRRYEVVKNTIAIPGSGYKVGDKFIVQARTREGRGLDDIYIRKTAEGFKVDWVATTQYDEIPMSTYYEMKMTNKTTLHIMAGSGWVNNNHIKNNNYLEIDCNLYVLKSSPAGQRISKLIKESPNGSVKLTVEVQGKNFKTEYRDVHGIIVTRIVSEDWFSE